MGGISFVTDENGKRVAVQIDLAKHGQLWEDFYDAMLVDSRKREPKTSLDALKRALR